MTGYLHLAPIKQPRRVLDVGAGTGTWMLEMAAEHPEAEFIGLDIAPLHLTTILPPNCKFELKNILEPQGFGYPDNYFDFAHQRFMALVIPTSRWTEHIEECVRVTAPGGWVEIGEVAVVGRNGGAATNRFNELVAKMFNVRGIQPDVAYHIRGTMQRAGLCAIKREIYRVPVGKWGGRLGEAVWENYRKADIRMSPAMAAANNMPHSKALEAIELLGKDIDQHRVYLEYYKLCGQKHP